MSAPLSSSFRRLWAAAGISNVGDGIRATALPLLATEVTSDPRLIAGVTVAERIPWLLLILPGGVWADRYDRRTLRVRLDVVRACIMAILAVLVATGNATIIVIFAVAALMAAAESIVDSSSMALVPALVDDDQLEGAGGIMSSTELVAGSLIGPPIGGLLFAVAFAVPFGLDAVSFAAAAIVAASIPGTFRPTTRRAQVRSFSGELRAGFSWLWRHVYLRNLALISMLLGFVTMIHSAVFVLFARDELGLGPVGFGLLLVPPAFGGVVGSLLAGRLRHRSLGGVLTVSVTVGGTAVALIAVTDNAAVVGLLTAIDAAAILVWNVLTVALRQRLIPDELLGRVGATYRFLVYAAMPLGAFVGGVIADRIDLRAAYAVAGIGQVAVAVLVPFAGRGGRGDVRIAESPGVTTRV